MYIDELIRLKPIRAYLSYLFFCAPKSAAEEHKHYNRHLLWLVPVVTNSDDNILLTLLPTLVVYPHIQRLRVWKFRCGF